MNELAFASAPENNRKNRQKHCSHRATQERHGTNREKNPARPRAEKRFLLRGKFPTLPASTQKTPERP